MLDVGWTELLVIAIVLIVVVGPKDLPPMLRAFGKTMTRLRAMAGDFRAQFDAALREADLEDVRKTIGDAQKLNPVASLREAIDPLRQTASDIKADLQKTVVPEKPETPFDTPVTVAAPAVAMALAETPPAVPVESPAATAVAPVATVAAGVDAKPVAKTPRKPRATAKAKADAVIDAVADKPKRAKATADGKKTAAPRKTAAATKKDDA